MSVFRITLVWLLLVAVSCVPASWIFFNSLSSFEWFVVDIHGSLLLLSPLLLAFNLASILWRLYELSPSRYRDIILLTAVLGIGFLAYPAANIIAAAVLCAQVYKWSAAGRPSRSTDFRPGASIWALGIVICLTCLTVGFLWSDYSVQNGEGQSNADSDDICFCGVHH